MAKYLWSKYQSSRFVNLCFKLSFSGIRYGKSLICGSLITITILLCLNRPFLLEGGLILWTLNSGLPIGLGTLTFGVTKTLKWFQELLCFTFFGRKFLNRRNVKDYKGFTTDDRLTTPISQIKGMYCGLYEDFITYSSLGRATFTLPTLCSICNVPLS